MYQEFADLCEERNVTPYRVAKECGFSNVTLSDWKNKNQMPKADKLVKIARFLDTTVEYLVTGEDAPAAAPAYRITAFEFQIIIAYRRLSEDAQDVVLSSLKLERPREKKELLQA